MFFALSVGIAQFVFVYNFVRTMRRRANQTEIREYESLHQEPTGAGIAQAG
jgi:hypothetical protein